MELTHLCYLIRMEKCSANRNQDSLLLTAFVQIIFVLLSKFITLIRGVHNFFSRIWSRFSFYLEYVNPGAWDEKNQHFESCICNCFPEKQDDGSLSREEVEKVMRELTLVCSPEGGELPLKWNFNELSGLFEEKEPSLEEVKEAFDVFDQNKDGFIDAMELQRVLSILGLQAGLELENCRKMIRTFDENGDGKIDFKEFVKFMENSFVEP